jgi:hypothetical protein
MQLATFDPYRTERRLQWSNRIARWRQRPGESAFHGGVLIVLATLLVVAAVRNAATAAPTLQSALQRWPLPIAIVALLLMTMRHAQQLATLRELARREWLVALPIAASLQARRRRDRLIAGIALHVLVGVPVLMLAGGGGLASVVFALCAASAALIAPALSRRITASARRREALISRLSDRGVGRVWRWQRIACGVALRGPRLALAAWALLLVPMGSGPLGVVLVACAGLTFASLATAWNRSLAVLPQAQSWLGAQPIDGAWLLLRSVVVPLVIAGIAASLCAGLFLALGTPLLAAFAALALLAGAGLHYACTAAERGRPRRIALRLTLHLSLLMAMLQAMPLLCVVLWPLQMLQLLRSARRR